MKIEYWHETDLNEDGSLGNPPELWRGTLETDPQLKTSYAPHFSSLSSQSNPHWMFVSTGRLKDESIHGITLRFDSEKEMNAFFANPKAIAQVETQS